MRPVSAQTGIVEFIVSFAPRRDYRYFVAQLNVRTFFRDPEAERISSKLCLTFAVTVRSDILRASLREVAMGVNLNAYLVILILFATTSRRYDYRPFLPLYNV
jgi:hypothetical protein